MYIFVVANSDTLTGWSKNPNLPIISIDYLVRINEYLQTHPQKKLYDLLTTPYYCLNLTIIVWGIEA